MLQAFYLANTDAPLVINASGEDTVVFFDLDQYQEFKHSDQCRDDVVFGSEINPNARASKSTSN